MDTHSYPVLLSFLDCCRLVIDHGSHEGQARPLRTPSTARTAEATKSIEASTTGQHQLLLHGTQNTYCFAHGRQIADENVTCRAVSKMNQWCDMWLRGSISRLYEAEIHNSARDRDTSPVVGALADPSLRAGREVFEQVVSLNGLANWRRTKGTVAEVLLVQASEYVATLPLAW